MHPEMDGEYAVVAVQCMGCSALEEHYSDQAEQAKKSDVDVDHSLKPFLIDVGPPDADLPPWAPNFAAVRSDD